MSALYPTPDNKLGYFSYRGLVVRVLVGGYEWSNIKFLTLSDLDTHLEKIEYKWNESIKKAAQ
jgi:hypothetical protein